jgi:Flp pilus assembly protein TadG
LANVIAKDQKLTRCTSGAAAVEFGLLLPGFAALLVGSLYASLMMYSAASMHYAVEEAARCYSVNGTTCSNASKTQIYAQGLYHGTNSPTFTASTPACGHQVGATMSFVLNMVVGKWTIPLSATSCFP